MLVVPDISQAITFTRRQKEVIELMSIDYSIPRSGAQFYGQGQEIYSFTGSSSYNLTLLGQNRRRVEHFIKINALGAQDWSEGQFNSLLKKCHNFLSLVIRQPEIFPTGRESIQMEYNKQNGDYLEFEVYLDKIEVLQIIDGNEKEFDVTSDDQIFNLVKNF